MKKLIYIIGFGFGLLSCIKENFKPNPLPPNPPKPIITDSTQIVPSKNLIGQTWVITGYRVSGIGGMINVNDTLVFKTSKTYNYINYESTYSFYSTSSAYNLTLNNTVWGNLSGTIYEGNLINGEIKGLKFTDITAGSGNTTDYYLWMHKI